MTTRCTPRKRDGDRALIHIQPSERRSSAERKKSKTTHPTPVATAQEVRLATTATEVLSHEEQNVHEYRVAQKRSSLSRVALVRCLVQRVQLVPTGSRLFDIKTSVLPMWNCGKVGSFPRVSRNCVSLRRAVPLTMSCRLKPGLLVRDIPGSCAIHGMRWDTFAGALDVEIQCS